MMSERRRNLISRMQATLGLLTEEAQVYLIVVDFGKMTIQQIAQTCSWNAEKAERYSNLLVSKGMFIQIATDQFESLHPRFALANRYRKGCSELGIKYGRNDEIDNLATHLERNYELARTR
jgi:predicted transcriptional regulator